MKVVTLFGALLVFRLAPVGGLPCPDLTNLTAVSDVSGSLHSGLFDPNPVKKCIPNCP
jgi:hypothetical protein